MKRRRVLALVRQGLMPPESLDGVPEREISRWKMEYDVLQALESLGHDVTCIEVVDELRLIREALEEVRPHIVFNMLEDFHGVVAFDANVVAYLELMRMPFTGCNSRGLVLSRDKALTKKICVYHRLPAPPFAVFPRGQRVRRPPRLDFPLIVKSLNEDASAGISQASIVENDEQLARRVEFVHEHIVDDAIAERFIDGREVYIGVLGNQRAQLFPPWELLMGGLPSGSARIATESVKFDLGYQERYDIRSDAAEDLPPGSADRMRKVARRLFRHLGMNGYARFDFRVTDDGEVYVLEGNANPDLAHDEDFAKAAGAAGISYDQLIQKVLSLGLRWHTTR